MVTIPELAKKYNLPYKRIFNRLYKLGIQPVRIENDPANYYKPAEVEPIIIELAASAPRPYHAPVIANGPEPEPELEIKVTEKIPGEYKTMQELSKIFNINYKTAAYRLKAAGIGGTRLTHRGGKKYYDINEVRPVLIKPTCREVKTYYAEQPITEEAEYIEQPQIEIEDTPQAENEAIDYLFVPPDETPDRSGHELTAEMCAVLTEFFGFEGARSVLINNYGLKPWKVATSDNK